MCLFSGNLARWPNLLWPPDSKEKQRVWNDDPSSGESGTIPPNKKLQKQQTNRVWSLFFPLSQTVLPSPISSSCSWLTEPKKQLYDRRTPQSSKDHCLYAVKDSQNVTLQFYLFSCSDSRESLYYLCSLMPKFSGKLTNIPISLSVDSIYHCLTVFISSKELCDNWTAD